MCAQAGKGQSSDLALPAEVRVEMGAAPAGYQGRAPGGGAVYQLAGWLGVLEGSEPDFCLGLCG